MNRRSRSLSVAVLLGAMAACVGAGLYLLPPATQNVPFAHVLTDLQVHVDALDAPNLFGLKAPDFEASPNDALAIIDIDDASLHSKYGPWPFKRSTYGTLLERLHAAGANVVAFDIDFIEPSADPREDAAFARGLRTMPSVLSYALNTTTGSSLGTQFPAATLRAAAASGYSSVDTPGGLLIGQPLELRAGTPPVRFRSLATATVETYGHTVNANAIPTLDGAMVLLPPRVSAHQLPDGTQAYDAPDFASSALSFTNAMDAAPADLATFARGRVIYIGSTAQALTDYFTTARARTPGLFANARFADQLMRGEFVAPAPPWFNVLLMLALPLLAASSFTLLRTPVAIATSALMTLVYVYASLALFITRLYWIDAVHVALALVLATLFVALYRVIDEGAQRRLVTELFGMHVSDAVVKDILSKDDPRTGLALAGKRVKATIFYSDIRGFTSLSESMEPEQMYAQLNEYFEEMCKIIFEYGGYVDKFIGDCVMAVFSAPYQRSDDARRAVVAAVKQQAKIAELSARWTAEGKNAFAVGMGINTGIVVMGNVGSRSRMNFTVIGDNVNVAARLYNVAKGGEIIISETTYDEVRDVVAARELEPVTVKGKAQPLRIYAVTALRAETV